MKKLETFFGKNSEQIVPRFFNFSKFFPILNLQIFCENIFVEKFELRAPAKINLNLKVGEKRGDFHFLKTKMEKVFLADGIIVSILPAAGARKIALKIGGSQKKGVPANSQNLLFRAVENFCREFKIRNSFEIILKKEIPHRAGLGGGSSDAGTILKFLREKFDAPRDRVREVARELGSDVPFFLENFSAAESLQPTGKISPVEKSGKLIAIALLPRIRISTKWAFEKWEKLPAAEKKQKTAANDFEKIAFRFFPDLQNLKNDFLKFGADFAGLSGTGAAIFAQFPDREKLGFAREKIEKNCDFFVADQLLSPRN